MDYEKMLERGMEKVKKPEGGDRFEVPKPQVLIEGAKTVIVNFNELASALRRKPEHLMKFLLRELATKPEEKGKRLVVLGNFPESVIEKEIDLYVKSYVACPECGKPDTRIIREDRFQYLKCEACGAKHPVSRV